MEWESKIGDIRRTKGLKQNFVAKSIHVSQQSLSSWERNESYPTANHLFNLARFLNVKVDDLYIRKDKE